MTRLDDIGNRNYVSTKEETNYLLKKTKSTGKTEVSEKFDLKISNKEMQRFADEELKRRSDSNGIQQKAFMADIWVNSKSLDKWCPRCVEFLAKIDRYALHNSNLITDLEKS
ncbi:hypothetical protein Hanom_Chr06g00528581 [Helianthus anomalus]